MTRLRTPGLAAVTTIAALVGALLFALLATAPPAEANDYYYVHTTSSSPCPRWSLQAVLDDPNGDWDRDRVTNADEIYVAGGLNPCVHDSTQFCSVQPASCWRYLSTDVVYYYHPAPVVTICSGGYWNWTAVNAHPYGDWDGDGVNNHTEAANGANPCIAPCPTAYYVDVALNPWGDWDGDGRSNYSEVNHGTNPCRYDGYVYVYTQPAPTQQRLPHVGGPSHAPAPTYTAPAPTHNPCPAGYPYFHPHNGKCYANPVNTPAGW